MECNDPAIGKRSVSLLHCSRDRTQTYDDVSACIFTSLHLTDVGEHTELSKGRYSHPAFFEECADGAKAIRDNVIELAPILPLQLGLHHKTMPYSVNYNKTKVELKRISKLYAVPNLLKRESNVQSTNHMFAFLINIELSRRNSTLLKVRMIEYGS